MRFPKMRPQGARRLSVPDLAGGLNLRDGVSEVLDNQLTQAKNVWWQDGVLKTRPGVYTDDTITQSVVIGESEKVDFRIFPNIRRMITPEHAWESVECVLRVRYQRSPIYEHPTGGMVSSFKFYWCCDSLEPIEFGSYSFPCDDILTYFVAQKGSEIYCYLSDGKILRMDYINGVESGFHEISGETYVPIVLTDCKADQYDILTKRPEDVMASGVMYEGYNLLGKAYKVQFTAFNPDIAWDRENELTGTTEKVHRMRYFLPESADDLIDKKIKVIHTGPKGVAEHEIRFPLGDEGDMVEADFNEIDGLKLCASGNEIYFTDPEFAGGVCLISDSESSYRNNIEVEIPYMFSENERARIFNATQCEWFGGGTMGVAGGTRLFLGGNTSEENKNLVIWSDLNNPLYFPENNYFRVGENSSAVTGFGRQADMLVIFKENGSGVYYTKYQQNNDIEAEDLINQSVVDYVASSVYFPLVQINPNIGCSYPDTIQLCRNRLVWLGDNGNVYTLVSESQYNERSVFCVSEMIRRDLLSTLKNSGAQACDWNGYYCILSGNTLYLMDYNCYGYTHVASYSKTEDANIRIPWYIWELPISGEMFVLGDKLLFSLYLDAVVAYQRAICTYVLSSDNTSFDVLMCQNEQDYFLENKTVPIETVLRTKLFTFGEASTRKSVDKINLQLGNNGGEPITVKVITDQSQEEHDIYLTGAETEAYTPGYIDSKAIFPTARNFLRIGLELSSEGVVAVDGMEIKFRLLGGSR